MGLIVIGGFMLAVFYHYCQGFYLGRGFPFDTFLFRPEDHFNDFRNGLRCIDHSLGGPAWDPEMRHPIWNLGWPFMSLLYYPFLPCGLRWGAVIWLGLFIAVFLVWCVRHLQGATPVVTARNVLVFSFLTYPFLFELDRANPEMFVFIFLAIFFGCHATPRHYWGLVGLSAAIAIKAIPGVYLVLLLCERRWRDSLLVGTLAVGLNLVSAAVLPGGFSHNIDRWLFQTTDFYQAEMVIGNGGLMFGNSLWGVGKVALETVHSMLHAAWPMATTLTKLQVPYLLACGVGFLLLVVYVVRYETVWWKRVTLLAFAMILLPYVSADYRLLHVFFPLFMFINSGERGRFAKFHTIMFALLLIPKGYVHLHPVREVSIQVVLNPLIMVAMSAAIIWEGLRSPANRQHERAIEA
ncbi:MAG: glycosyltransferase family 87 protein [Verrucomicrobia bacterium]|nr:glycosyltransferase family 87 protein [Verrucomicrobiota bacterium]